MNRLILVLAFLCIIPTCKPASAQETNEILEIVAKISCKAEKERVKCEVKIPNEDIKFIELPLPEEKLPQKEKESLRLTKVPQRL